MSELEQYNSHQREQNNVLEGLKLLKEKAAANLRAVSGSQDNAFADLKKCYREKVEQLTVQIEALADEIRNNTFDQWRARRNH